MDEEQKRNLQWKKTCDHLKRSFDAWEEVSKMDLGPSASEKQLAEFKALLCELKNKVEELSGDHSQIIPARKPAK